MAARRKTRRRAWRGGGDAENGEIMKLWHIASAQNEAGSTAACTINRRRGGRMASLAANLFLHHVDSAGWRRADGWRACHTPGT